MKIYRIGFRYDYMAKFRLMHETFSTRDEAERSAKKLIDNKPFKTYVFEIDTDTDEIKA